MERAEPTLRSCRLAPGGVRRAPTAKCPIGAVVRLFGAELAARFCYTGGRETYCAGGRPRGEEVQVKQPVHESAEDYRKAVLALECEHGYVRAVDVTDRLDVSKALSKLECQKLMHVVARDVRLTAEGRAVAERVSERNGFFRALLVDAGVTGVTADGGPAASSTACARTSSASSPAISTASIAPMPARLPAADGPVGPPPIDLRMGEPRRDGLLAGV